MNQEYKCPCCGGAVRFDSAVQKVKCPFCDTEFDISTFIEYDKQLENEGGEKMEWENHAGREWESGEAESMTEYVCKSCGGTIICDETTAATSCPYCGNPVVMMGKLSGMLKPNYIIPFKKSKEDAKAAYFEFLKNKKLLPDKFKDENVINEIKGLYVPFWLFDADVDANFRFRATKLRCWSDSTYDYTETSFYSVVRGGSLGFSLIPVDGSVAMPDDLMESIEPFDFSEAEEFHTAYFAGYIADKYDVDEKQSVERANGRIKNSTTAIFRGTVTGYNSVNVENTNVSFKNTKAMYAMYPVWILSTSWNGENYLFAMNGQTGKLTGNLPIDKKKFWTRFIIYSVLAGAIVFGIVFLIALLFNKN